VSNFSIPMFSPIGHVVFYWLGKFKMKTPCRLLLTWGFLIWRLLDFPFLLYIYIYIYLFTLLFFSTRLIKFITWGLSVIFQTFLLFPTSSIYSFLFFMPFHFWQKFGRFNSFLRFFVFLKKEKNIIFINSELHPKSIYFIKVF
jgi:hypothetical protein